MLQKRKIINIPQSGTYTLSGRASIRAVASMSSPELAYFDNGSSVYYDQIFEAEGHQWISYIGYSGNRRYVVIN
ncbi:SH3 domain-containing protein [Streptococcus gordonii]|jgi:carboxypeptidase (fragment)|uniref:SH3 domain-containing protein n=1 Tax=Streptococcus gordonii TaxID=1302 RepID=UPI0039C17B15